MSSLSLALLLSTVLFSIALSNPARPGFPSQPASSCSLSEYDVMPCVCCKKNCWYTIAAATTHELGHMPGEAGEQEAMATLQLIRACMISECSAVCKAPRLI